MYHSPEFPARLAVMRTQAASELREPTIIIKCELSPAANLPCGIAKKAKPPNRHTPHQGKHKKERRKKRMEKSA